MSPESPDEWPVTVSPNERRMRCTTESEAPRHGHSNSLDVRGAGDHLLSEIAAWVYPSDLDISLELSGDDMFGEARPHRSSQGTLIFPYATARAPSNRDYVHEIAFLPSREQPLFTQHRAWPDPRRLHGRQTRRGSELTSTSTSHTINESTLSRSNGRFRAPSRTTFDRQTDDAATDADVQGGSERPLTTNNSPGHTPSHRSFGTREDTEEERGGEFFNEGPPSPLPYSGVYPYNLDRVRDVVEDYERRHG